MREDLLFLHKLKKVVEIKGAETSLLFMPYMIQLKTTYRNARLNLRKRMVHSTTEDNNRIGETGEEDEEYDAEVEDTDDDEGVEDSEDEEIGEGSTSDNDDIPNGNTLDLIMVLFSFNEI